MCFPFQGKQDSDHYVRRGTAAKCVVTLPVDEAQDHRDTKSHEDTRAFLSKSAGKKKTSEQIKYLGIWMQFPLLIFYHHTSLCCSFLPHMRHIYWIHFVMGVGGLDGGGLLERTLDVQNCCFTGLCNGLSFAC